jgi:hypothetical protein
LLEVKAMIYELRIYRCVPGRMRALLARFENETLRIWKKHGIRQAGFWTTLIGKSSQEITYILAWDSMAEREKRWDAFLADPNGSLWSPKRSLKLNREGTRGVPRRPASSRVTARPEADGPTANLRRRSAPAAIHVPCRWRAGSTYQLPCDVRKCRPRFAPRTKPL